MANKDLRELELEILGILSELDESIDRLVKKLGDMKQYEDSGSVEGDELKSAVQTGLDVMSRLQDPNCQLADLMRHVIHPDTRDRQLSQQDMRWMKSELDKNLAEIKAIDALLNELELKFGKYNLPKRGSCEPFMTFLARLSEFMRVTWRETAEKSREKGYKSLMDWVVWLGRSDEEGRRFASRTLKAVLEATGIEISRFLVDYLWMISVFAGPREIAERLLEIDTVIRCLSVEEGSVVIESFAGVVEFFHRTMRMAKGTEKGKSVDDQDGSPWMEKETELFRMIAIEILRLEVSFRSPDLPMVLLNSMYLLMGEHLMENVFKDKLDAILVKINDIKAESRRQSITDFCEEILNSGVKEVWNGLDLNAMI